MKPGRNRLEYPRTLLRVAALPDVRAFLAAPDRLVIYQTLWADVQAAPPGDNATIGGRRICTTHAKNAAFVMLLNQELVLGVLAALMAARCDARGAVAAMPETALRLMPVVQQPAQGQLLVQLAGPDQSATLPPWIGWSGWLANSFVGPALRSISRRWHRAFTAGERRLWAGAGRQPENHCGAIR